MTKAKEQPRFIVEQNHEWTGGGTWIVRDTITGKLMSRWIVRADARKAKQALDKEREL